MNITGTTLGPFVAWLVTRERDEQTRRRHRMVVEHYLVWCRTERVPRHERRARYLAVPPGGITGDHAAEALERFDEFRRIQALTEVADR
ncbi:hypothetical protein PSU4_11610 [Pseudonocardia sulfidoxydans NBRC 16205]|uniref:Core-binding (CB) domain-containing protein n=1 Tax=Pseudonocardia sulfidoxydans NBRC 16205 TaxID=1223511 RepID=A0A511DCC1_9PSEU|nr:hypothetical protein [Pseudonocardia sulfidoxydans]GEL22207.1 hypothetical protein PSU4_11610 [Pseudonocardia sulfidoxydans NBRC 16205]